jgi:hypothetical protein
MVKEVAFAGVAHGALAVEGVGVGALPHAAQNDAGFVRLLDFIARNPQGEMLWIYRELAQPDHWFLHGHFG